MSRSRTGLRCVTWWGGWARLFRRDNLEARQRGRIKRDKDRQRIDAREFDDVAQALLEGDLESGPIEALEPEFTLPELDPTAIEGCPCCEEPDIDDWYASRSELYT